MNDIKDKRRTELYGEQPDGVSWALESVSKEFPTIFEYNGKFVSIYSLVYG